MRGGGITRAIIISLFATLACAGIIKAVTTIGTNISTGGTLDVIGVSTLTGNTNIAGSLTSSGVNTLYGATNIGGAITATSTLNVLGASTLAGALNIYGNSTISNLTATGTLGVLGASTLTGALTVYGNSTLSNLTATGTLSVLGASTLTGALTGYGNTTLTNLTATGTLTAGNFSYTKIMPPKTTEAAQHGITWGANDLEVLAEAGNLGEGLYKYALQYCNAAGNCSPLTDGLWKSVTTSAGNTKVKIHIPNPSFSNQYSLITTARICRTQLGGSYSAATSGDTQRKLADVTFTPGGADTDYTDNLSDNYITNNNNSCTYNDYTGGYIQTTEDYNADGEYDSLLMIAPQGNVMIGHLAGGNLASASFGNTCGGFNACKAITMANGLTTWGYKTLQSDTIGMDSTAIGASALVSSVGNNSATALGSGALNSLVGDGANNSGNNTALGAFSGAAMGSGNINANANNVLVGDSAGYSLGSTASGASTFNVVIGSNACRTLSTNCNVTMSNKLWIHGGDNDNPLIFGDFSARTLTFNGEIASAPQTTTLVNTALAITRNFVNLTCNSNALTTITGGVAGQQITALFKDACAVTDNDTQAANTIDINETFQTFAAKDTLTLVFDGTSWYEVNHSDNTP